MKLIIALYLSTLLLTNFAFASLSDSCKDLNECVKKVSEITSKKYLYTIKLKGSLEGTKNITLNKDNADELLSYALNQNGYTRIVINESSYSIISTRDVRYNTVQQISADFNTPPKLPKVWDYYMMNYKVKSQYIGGSVARSLRPFMSRYGRIIDVKSNGSIIVQDSAVNLKRLYDLIKSMDVVPTKEFKKKLAQKEKERFKLKQLEAKNCKPFKDQLNYCREKLGSKKK